MIGEILARFEDVRRLRRGAPKLSLEAAGDLVSASLHELAGHAERREIPWKGAGPKQYDVYSIPGSNSVFSRGVNRDLFIHDAAEFSKRWSEFVNVLEKSKDTDVLVGIAGTEVDQLFYTAVVGYGAIIDLFAAGNRGGPGTFFECLVGPCISWLTGRNERSSVEVPLPAAGKRMKVPTDLSFSPNGRGATTLVIPTKISTRERISQPYVHQRILDSDESQTFRSALCVANENNMVGGRSLESAYLKDTLVPGTIVQYEAFVAEMSGLYYLDPPNGYLPPPDLFPPVKEFHALLTYDLPLLVA